MRLAGFVAISFACAAPAFAQDDGQAFAEVRMYALPGATGTQWQLVQRVRPTFQARLWERARLVVTVEAHLAQGRDASVELRRAIENSDLGKALDQAGYVWPDAGHRIFRVRDASDYLDVDRFYLDVYRPGWDVRIGRQALKWGSAQFFNPTDPFAEVLLSEPWRPRRGINAVRATVPFGAMRDGVVVVAVDDDFERPRLAGRLRIHAGGVDVAASGAWERQEGDALVGVDLRGTHLVGWWVEAARFRGSHTDLVAGIDYSFPVLERLMVLAQYYRNGTGAAHPDDYRRFETLAGDGLFGHEGARQGRFTLGRDYALLGITTQVTPDFSVNAHVLQNLNDGTGFVIPTLSHLITDQIDVSLSAQIPFSLWGAGGEFRPRHGDMRFERALVPGSAPIGADLSGLIPDATLTFWMRMSF